MERLNSRILLKRNLKALLKHRGKTQGQLARHLRRKGADDKDADSWISGILAEHNPKGFPMEYWDGTAEFLGVDVYHFFLPGVVANYATERRSGSDRRKWVERRKGLDVPERPRDLDLHGIIRILPPDGVERVIEAALKILDDYVRRRPRGTRASVVDPERTAETAATVHAPARDRKKP